MFDFPSYLPSGALAMCILENPNGWSVLIFRTPLDMLLHNISDGASEEAEFVVAHTTHSLVDAISWCRSENLHAIHDAAFGDKP